MQLNSQTIYEAVQDKLAKAEKVRRSNKSPALITFSIILIATLAFLGSQVYFGLTTNPSLLSAGWIVAITILCTIAFFVAGYIFFHKIEKIFKQEIVPAIIQHIGSNFHYEPDKEIDKTLIYSTKLFRETEQYGGDHLVSGLVEGRLLEFSNVETRTKFQNEESENSKRSKTVFKGVFFHLQLKTALPKPFWIIPRSNKLLWGFPALQKLDNGGFVDIPNLDKRYRVFTIAPDLVKQLLAPSFVGELNNLYADFRTNRISKKPLLFAFFNDHMCLAFKRNKDIFSLPLFPIFKPIDHIETVERQLLFVNAALRLEEIL